MRVLSDQEMQDVAGGFFFNWFSCFKWRAPKVTCDSKPTYTQSKCDPKPTCEPKPSCEPKPTCEPTKPSVPAQPELPQVP
ncbi:MAG: hypothetical protein R3E56_10950 [Burkholderiaceae bacterium]